MPERASSGSRSPDPGGGRRDGSDRFAAPDLSALPVTGFTRRRMALLAATFVVAWLVIAFARQASDASEATSRLQDMQASNAQLANQVAALQREYEQIQGPAWVAQQARGYGLGSDREIPFTLSADAPALAADAPGSAAARLGADPTTVTPLDAWLTLLFGPER